MMRQGKKNSGRGVQMEKYRWRKERNEEPGNKKRSEEVGRC